MMVAWQFIAWERLQEWLRPAGHGVIGIFGV
jgi:hypothetical protein